MSDEENEEYQIDRVLDMAKIDGEWHFNIKWKGFKITDSTWEPKENFVGASLEMVENFEKTREKRPKYDKLCIMALEGMPKRKGSSLTGICDWTEERFDKLPKGYRKEIGKALKMLVDNAELDKVKQTYFLPPSEKITKKRRTKSKSVRKIKKK
eukprot:gene12201-5788_t